MKIPKFEAQTEWVKPTEFPDLRDVDEIAIDLETKDPDLLKKGSGSVIGNGEVIAIAVATKFYKGYFPIAVSPESIVTLAPSSTALVISKTSAFVG